MPIIRVFVLTLIALCDGPYALADTDICRNDRGEAVASISGATSDLESGLACDALLAARRFLSPLEIDMSREIQVRIVARGAPFLSEHSLGCYVKDRGEVLMLNHNDCAASLIKHPMFGRPLDEAMYQSILAHEFAHALADANFKTPKPSQVAHEYIAYVTQFGVMPEEMRGEILANFSDTGPVQKDSLSFFLWMMAPQKFALMAYLHFKSHSDGFGFIRDLLDGKQTFPSPSDPFFMYPSKQNRLTPE